jgi:hypothetical protein
MVQNFIKYPPFRKGPITKVINDLNLRKKIKTEKDNWEKQKRKLFVRQKKKHETGRSQRNGTAIWAGPSRGILQVSSINECNKQYTVAGLYL